MTSPANTISTGPNATRAKPQAFNSRARRIALDPFKTVRLTVRTPDGGKDPDSTVNLATRRMYRPISMLDAEASTETLQNTQERSTW